MAFSRITGSHAEGQNGNSASARTLQYGGNLTPGSLLEVTVTTFGTAITVTVSDGTNGAYTDSGAGYVVNGSDRISKWFFANNSSSGQPTVTVTPSATAFVSIAIDEYTGGATSSPVRATSTNVSVGAGTTATTGSVTATAGDLVVTAMSDGNAVAGADSVSSPFSLITNLGSAVNEGIITAVDTNAPGNENCTFTRASSWSASWIAISVSYKPASASSTGAVKLVSPGARPGFALAGIGGLAG